MQFTRRRSGFTTAAAAYASIAAKVASTATLASIVAAGVAARKRPQVHACGYGLWVHVR